MNIASLKEQLAINAKLAIERLKNFRPERRHAFLAGKLAALGLLLGLLGVLLLWVLVYTGCLGPLPTAEELRNIRHHTASEVYTADSVLMGKYYIENRSRVQYEDIAPSVIQALVATEDARFYEHNGVDARSLARVGIKSVLLGDESAGGGSTISQQLAKNLYPRRRAYGPFSMPVNKLKEMIIARRLEKVYSKEEILTLYLNTVPFGENVFGIAAAADRFFHESPARLKPEQAAVLVGMLKATTAYNPRLHPDKSLARRNVVLDQMHKYDYLPAEVADSLKALPLELNYHYITHNSGLAPYFREHLRHEIEQMLEGTPYNLYTDGLKIYTTIDSRMQRYAEQAVATEMKRIQAAFFKHWQGRNPWGNEEDVILRAIKQSERYRMLKRQGLSEEEIRKSFEQPVPMSLFSWEGEQNKEMSPLDSLKYYNHFLHAGFMAMEPHTGFVRAWVGGIDHKYFQYDHVKSRRQVGSTFKPIVYAAALEQGIDPCEYISNERLVYKAYDDWSPGNADGNYEGAYSMQGGLARSVNTITVKLMMQTGPDKVARLAHNMGVESEIPEDPSIALGTADISLYEMLTVYATLANRGRRPRPVYITAIADRDGKLIKKGKLKQSYPRVLKTETADMLIHMMQAVVDSGTAAGLRSRYGLHGDIIGKTGTTQSHADGWFIGATPYLVAGAWVGAEDRRVRFRSLSLGQGGRTALPIYGRFMQQVYKDPRFRRLKNKQFPQPSARVKRKLNCPMYKEDPNKNFWDFLRFTRKQREQNRRYQQMLEEYDAEAAEGSAPAGKARKESAIERFRRKKAEKERRRKRKRQAY